MKILACIGAMCIAVASYAFILFLGWASIEAFRSGYDPGLPAFMWLSGSVMVVAVLACVVTSCAWDRNSGLKAIKDSPRS